ncbi:MAG: histidinol-phosphate transaminase [Granulosicoccus sp.]|nr:histidinol-phosphate transaminase [Granulosicoccus sp.]
MDRYWSDRVRQLHPYVPGEQPRDQPFIKLNTNENPYAPSPRVISAIKDCADARLRLYPDPESNALRDTIAASLEVGRENVFVGNGSDEVLALTFQAFFSGTGSLLFPDISYSFYPVYCGLFGIEPRQIPLADDFSLDLRPYLNSAREGNAGIIFPNPNAPTSIALGLGAITELLEKNSDSVVVIDEAYVDFGADTAVPLCARFPNLLVTRTLSKSGSLAGMRVGYAVGHEGLIQALTRIKDSFNSYPIDVLAQAAAQAAIEDSAYFSEICQRIISTRNRSAEALTELGFTVCDSSANFLFVTHQDRDAADLAVQLREQGILVRHWTSPRIAQYLRITVGTDDEMHQLIEVLHKCL